MERFKVENFLKEHPDEMFPEVTALPREDALRFAAKLREELGIPARSSPSEMVQLLDAMESLVEGTRADEHGFSVRGTVMARGIQPEECVMINWYQYDEIDRIRLSDLDNHLGDIWYPSADDIDIFDSTCTWVLSISHDGIVKVTKSDGGRLAAARRMTERPGTGTGRRPPGGPAGSA